MRSSGFFASGTSLFILHCAIDVVGGDNCTCVLQCIALLILDFSSSRTDRRGPRGRHRDPPPQAAEDDPGAEEEPEEEEEPPVKYVDAPVPTFNPWTARKKSNEQKVPSVDPVPGEELKPEVKKEAEVKKAAAEPLPSEAAAVKAAAAPAEAAKVNGDDKMAEEPDVMEKSDWPSLADAKPEAAEASSSATAASAAAPNAQSSTDAGKENNKSKERMRKKKGAGNKWTPVEIPFTPSKRGGGGGKGKGGERDRNGPQQQQQQQHPQQQPRTAESSKNWRDQARGKSCEA